MTLRRAGDVTLTEQVLRGTFEYRGGALTLALRDEGVPPGGVAWRPLAAVELSPVDGPPSIRLQYPAPADGPDIVEAYRPRAP